MVHTCNPRIWEPKKWRVRAKAIQIYLMIWGKPRKTRCYFYSLSSFSKLTLLLLLLGSMCRKGFSVYTDCPKEACILHYVCVPTVGFFSNLWYYENICPICFSLTNNSALSIQSLSLFCFFKSLPLSLAPLALKDTVYSVIFLWLAKIFAHCNKLNWFPVCCYQGVLYMVQSFWNMTNNICQYLYFKGHILVLKNTWRTSFPTYIMVQLSNCSLI